MAPTDLTVHEVLGSDTQSAFEYRDADGVLVLRIDASGGQFTLTEVTPFGEKKSVGPPLNTLADVVAVAETSLDSLDGVVSHTLRTQFKGAFTCTIQSDRENGQVIYEYNPLDPSSRGGPFRITQVINPPNPTVYHYQSGSESLQSEDYRGVLYAAEEKHLRSRQ
ncbi:hypothetical protein IPJ72_06370 [Candidatus Peregrinibacteria bacterium]|nr:MAG: hypothetical protein IPJ72_06370 [Candidatus Peregrinibacteria bacterium]